METTQPVELGIIGKGWVEEKKTTKGIKFIARWAKWEADPSSPTGRKKVHAGRHELGPKVRFGGEDALKTKRDAEKKWLGISDAVMGLTADLPPVLLREKTFKEYAEQVFMPDRKPSLRPKSLWALNYYMARLIAEFGEIPLDKMSKPQMQTFLNRIAAEKKSYTIIHHCLNYLRATLQFAVDTTVLRMNEALHLKIPDGVRRPKRPYLSLGDFHKLLAEIPTFRDKLMIQILYFCALRRRELFALRMQDWDGTSLDIQHQWDDETKEAELNGRSRLAEVKAGAGKVAVPDGLRKDLTDWAKFTSLKPDAFMFQSASGVPINSRNWLRRVLQPAATRAGMEAINYHMFRRGHATEQHERGVSDKAIQGQLRHSDPNVTRRIYMQVIEENQQAAVSGLETASEAIPPEKCSA